MPSSAHAHLTNYPICQSIHHTTHRVDEAGTPLIGLGHSLGGAMLILISTRHPHLFQQLIVLDPPM